MDRFEADHAVEDDVGLAIVAQSTHHVDLVVEGVELVDQSSMVAVGYNRPEVPDLEVGLAVVADLAVVEGLGSCLSVGKKADRRENRHDCVDLRREEDHHHVADLVAAVTVGRIHMVAVEDSLMEGLEVVEVGESCT